MIKIYLALIQVANGQEPSEISPVIQEQRTWANYMPDLFSKAKDGQFYDLNESSLSIMHAFPIYGDDPEHCVSNSDCQMYPYEVCDVSQDLCEHKKVFPPTWLEIGGLATFSFVMALCVVAGIGGGGIAVSLIIAFFKFTTKPAVAASSFSILINSIMRYAYNWNTKHPSKKGMVLVDYSLATVMSPTTLAGSQIGSLVLESFPDLYIQILLTLLLGILGIQSARKALELHRKEED